MTSSRHMVIEQIRQLPAQLAALVDGLTPVQLTTAYIPGEWTVAQNIHHLADSHMNSYIRCKLIATENNPTLKPYDLLEPAASRLISIRAERRGKMYQVMFLCMVQDTPSGVGSDGAFER